MRDFGRREELAFLDRNLEVAEQAGKPEVLHPALPAQGAADPGVAAPASSAFDYVIDAVGPDNFTFKEMVELIVSSQKSGASEGCPCMSSRAAF